MAENEELKSMPDPNAIAVTTSADDHGDTTRPADVSTGTGTAAALDPEMKVVKNYVRKTAEEQEEAKKPAEGH